MNKYIIFIWILSKLMDIFIEASVEIRVKPIFGTILNNIRSDRLEML